MKAAILLEHNKDLIIDDIVVPPLEYGQVLVKLDYTTICGSQLGEISNIKEKSWTPNLLGHEATGKVLEIGSGVKYVKPNDDVVLHWRKGIGIESETPKYKLGNKAVNAGWITTFNEMAVISENRITKVENIDKKLGCLFGCAITTAFGAISNDANMKIGESICIFGAGGVGLPMVLAAKMNSASDITVVDISQDRLNFATKLGANKVYLYKDFNSKENYDIAIDCTGKKDIIEKAYSIAKRTILVGVSNESISIDCMPLHFCKRIIGSHGGNAYPTNDIPRISKVIKLENLQPMISKEYTLDQINVAISDMKKGIAIKPLIKL